MLGVDAPDIHGVFVFPVKHAHYIDCAGTEL
jgi:hypothetical protein